MGHKFSRGQTVTFQGYTWEIVLRLPELPNGEPQYRIRDVASGAERVVREAEIRAAEDQPVQPPQQRSPPHKPRREPQMHPRGRSNIGSSAAGHFSSRAGDGCAADPDWRQMREPGPVRPAQISTSPAVKSALVKLSILIWSAKGRSSSM